MGKGLVTNYGDGGGGGEGYKAGEVGHVKFCPFEKRSGGGGVAKVF